MRYHRALPLQFALIVAVTVDAGRYTDVTISFDSGIRGGAPPG